MLVRYLCSLLLAHSVLAQPAVITTVAGASRGFGGDGGPSSRALVALANLQNSCDPNQFEQTVHLSVDPAGNLYIADSENQRIRRIAPDGTIATIAGSGEKPAIKARCEPSGPIGDGDRALAARLYNPADVLLHPNGNLIIADQQNNRIRQVNAAGVIGTIAGNGLHNLYAPGIPATSSPMDWPSALAIDAAGTLYFAEIHSNRVGRIGADGRIATVAGTGFPGYNGDGIAATSAQLRKPAGIAIDAAGNLYIADSGNHRIRKVTPAGVITTVAGTGQPGFSGDSGPSPAAALSTPMDVKLDALGSIFVADMLNHRVRRIDVSGVITTVAGTGEPGRGVEGIAGTASSLNYPAGLAVDRDNNVYIADWQNYLVRKLSFGIRPAIAAGGVVNAASYAPAPAPVAPGSLIAIFGSNFAASTATASEATWPLSLAGTAVQVNGAAIPLYLVSPAQINAQLPFETELGKASVTILSAGAVSATLEFQVAPAAIGILQSQPGRGAVVNQDGILNTQATPALRGDAMVVYVTGIGRVDPAVRTGEAAPLDVLSPASLPATATIGGIDAPVLFLGLAPGFVGLAQANILIPQGTAVGDDVPLSLTSGGLTSNVVSISVRP